MSDHMSIYPSQLNPNVTDSWTPQRLRITLPIHLPSPRDSSHQALVSPFSSFCNSPTLTCPSLESMCILTSFRKRCPISENDSVTVIGSDSNTTTNAKPECTKELNFSAKLRRTATVEQLEMMNANLKALLFKLYQLFQSCSRIGPNQRIVLKFHDVSMIISLRSATSSHNDSLASAPFPCKHQNSQLKSCVVASRS